MNAEATSIGQLTVTERAVIAFRSTEREAELKALAGKTTDIVTITNSDGHKQVYSARVALKNERVALEKFAKELRDDATKFSKAVIAEEKRLIGIIEPEETRLQRIEKAWDDAREAERQAKIAAELKRVEALREAVAELHGCPTLTPASGSALIADHIADLERVAVDDSFQEFKDQAIATKAQGLKRLQALHVAAVEHEIAQRKLEEERAELARLREAEARREAETRARLAEEERVRREAQAKADAEAKAERDRLAAIAKAERDAEAKRQADERAENERKDAERRAELDRQEREARERQAAEDARLAAERAEFERQQEAAKPKPVFASSARKVARTPSRDEIVSALSTHFDAPIPIVRYWLRSINWQDNPAQAS